MASDVHFFSNRPLTCCEILGQHKSFRHIISHVGLINGAFPDDVGIILALHVNNQALGEFVAQRVGASLSCCRHFQ